MATEATATTARGNWISQRWLYAVGSAAVVLLAGGLVAAVAATANGHHTASDPITAAGPTAAVPVVSVDNKTGGLVAWDKPLTVRVDVGHLTAISVTDDRGLPVFGAFGDSRRQWQSNGALTPAATYTVKLANDDPRGKGASQTLVLKTTDTGKKLTSVVSPGDGDTVGIGMPITVRFNRPVADNQRADVERRVSVSASPSVIGAWHWIRPNEAHWRPPDYWQSGTKVTVTIDLERLNLGSGLWGADRHSATFTVGDSHISTADISSHKMTVTSNGQVVKVFPISAGRDKYPTRGGPHIALEKSKEVTMDSQTVGIPRNSPDGYYEKVLWDVRISNAGAFVHAAPWSVGSQGRANVSHGCVNLSTADAQWFYDFSRRGDVVDVIHGTAPPDVSDPGMADWNVPWETWSASDPLHSTGGATGAS